MEQAWEVVDVRKFRPLIIILIVLVVLAIAVGSSVVSIGGDEVGIVEKKFGGGKLPPGKILAVDGENGVQAPVLAPGWHFFYWPWKYNINKVPMVKVEAGKVGLVQAIDGLSLPANTIYAPEWADPKKMLDAAYFLSKGKGFKGPQLTVLNPGTYRLNTRLFKITFAKVTNVPVGSVAVIKSNVGEVVKSEDGLVEEGRRGIIRTPLLPQEYYLNTGAFEVTVISTRQVKVSYTAGVERGERKTQPLKPITVRSADGFTFPVDVRVTYLIESQNAPRVVAKIGDDDLVLTKLVTPALRAVFRNNAEKVKALEYVQNRSVQEAQSAKMLKEELEKYGVTVLAVRIGDIGDEKSLGILLKTQTDREIALQEIKTFEQQQLAAEKQKALSKTTQEAEEEKRLATAAYEVKIAAEQKRGKIIAAEAEAEQLKLVAEAKAEAYRKISEVIGSDNAALIEIMKLVAERGIQITPDVMVGSGGAGMTDALMGTVLQGMLEKKTKK